MRKQIGGDINTQVEINTQEINTLTNQVNQLKSFVNSLEQSSSQSSGDDWKAQSVESIQQSRGQRPTEQTPAPVQDQSVVTTQSQLSEADQKAAKRAQIQANIDKMRACQQRNEKLKTYNTVINTCGSLSNWGNTQDKVVPGVTMNGQDVICSTQPTGSVNDTFSSKIMGNQNQENLREALCQGKQQCVYNIPVNKKDFKKAKLATLEDCQSGKKTNRRKNKRSNKKSSRKQRAGNLCQQNRCQQLSLMNDKLNIYAPYPNNSGPFPAAAFTGNYRIDGPLPRGTTVPQAIHQVNLRKNVYPGGKTRKNKLNKRKTKRRN